VGTDAQHEMCRAGASVRALPAAPLSAQFFMASTNYRARIAVPGHWREPQAARGCRERRSAPGRNLKPLLKQLKNKDNRSFETRRHAVRDFCDKAVTPGMSVASTEFAGMRVASLVPAREQVSR
jgi:hypothetical protein